MHEMPIDPHGIKARDITQAFVHHKICHLCIMHMLPISFRVVGRDRMYMPNTARQGKEEWALSHMWESLFGSDLV